MSEELKQAAQQALEAMRYHVEQTRPIQKTSDAIAHLERALTQRPAAQAGEREAFEAELAKMPDWAPECEKLRPWVEWILWVFWQARASLPTQPAAQAEAHPLARRFYTMSGPHLSGHRLILGFETMEASQAAHSWVANLGKPAAQATPDVPETDFGKMATPEPLHLFEFWWESHMPQATQSQAWAAWTAAQNSKGATIDAAQATPEPVQPRTFDARNATFREQNWQIRFDAAVESRRLAQEQLYTERERHTAEVKRLQLEIGRLTATPEPVGEVVAWLVSLPEEPELGEWFSEQDMSKQGYTSKPLFTHPAPGVPEGFVLVPVEPTPEILEAIRDAWSSLEPDPLATFLALLSPPRRREPTSEAARQQRGDAAG